MNDFTDKKLFVYSVKLVKIKIYIYFFVLRYLNIKYNIVNRNTYDSVIERTNINQYYYLYIRKMYSLAFS